LTSLRDDRMVAALAAVVFTAASVTCAVLSDGFLTADALTHYLYAKYAFAEPYLLVDVWGRPLVTALYAVPATLGGRLGVRITSLLLALICSVAAYQIARGQGLRRPVLALLFTLAQPLVFLNSFAEMTELPFATLAALAFWAYQSRQWGTAAALAALLPLARPEGFELVALAAVGLTINRKFLPTLLLPLPLLAWNHAGWELFGREGAWWRWLPDHWPYARESAYPSGNLLQFVYFLPAVVGPLVLPATLVGMWLSISGRPESDRHLRTCRVATAAIPLSILAVHSLLYALGKMASYGEPRYLLVAAPLWAVLSARGWEWIINALRWRQPVRWALVASVLPASVLLYHRVLPLRRPAHWETAERVASYIRERLAPAGYTKIMVAHPAVFYYLGVSPTDRGRIIEWRRDTVAYPAQGAALVWDPIYSPRNATAERSLTLAEIRSAGWVQWDDLTVSESTVRPTPDPSDQLQSVGQWFVFISPHREK
jgi:hypothetical protein